MENVFAPLSDACAKALGEKQYEKRKLASAEIEKMVMEFNSSKNNQQIKKLLHVLKAEFCANRDVNKRKGGLIGLASMSIALGKDTEKYIHDLVFPILTCCMDADSKVRYYATESLYNVVKVARNSIIQVFPEIFSALAKLSSDPEATVKNGSELLDRLLKDIVQESYKMFDLKSFLPLIRERLYTKNSFARQFIISWISVLNAVPEINMLAYLPEILDGLFQILDDSASEIQRMDETLLLQFLRSVKPEPESDIKSMTNILIGHAQSSNELIQSTAISWLRQFVQISGVTMLEFASGIFQAILPSLAFEDESRRHIRESAIAVNTALLELATNKPENLRLLNLTAVMNVLGQYLVNSSVQTKIAVLKWVHHLFTEIHDSKSDEMFEHAKNLSPALLDVLSSDSSEDVVLESLVVLAEIVNATKTKGDAALEAQYKSFLCDLLGCFKKDVELLNRRGDLIIRQLCVLLNSKQVYKTFAEILADEANLIFISTIIRTLNAILLTSPELFELRTALKDIDTDPEAKELFLVLYKSWAHCPVSTLALCLLGHCYLHVAQIIAFFNEIEVTVELLEEVDKLVQLIESPIFSTMRLTLVSYDRKEAQYLAQALYGVLMLLPQTEAFHLLRNRLQCVPNFWQQHSKLEEDNVEFTELLSHFKHIQTLHRTHKIEQRKTSVKLWEKTK